MSLEIELKARIEKPDELKARLSELGNFCYSYQKNDTYWSFPRRSDFKLRVRQQTATDEKGESKDSTLITFKTKGIRDGVEVNNERELTVSDGKVFEEILSHMGLVPFVKKEKRGMAWECGKGEGVPQILAELSDVKHLGWFLELEIQSENVDERDIENNRQRLLDLLGKLDIPASKIEARPYTELLTKCPILPGYSR